jgi:anaerobic magnesium-protoporphyrin IX monomethyl ester cyclase
MPNDYQAILVAPEIINPRAMPCVGLGFIGAYLASQGIAVRIIDAQFTKEDPLPILRAASPTLVAIGVDSRTIHRGLKIAGHAKRYGHTTMLGGLHVSLIKGKILDFPEVDYGIVGDGEVPTHQLLQALRGERALASVSGLVYRTPDGQVKVNPNTTEAADLDSLPFPDYRLAGIHHFPLYPLVTSRDCPYKCAYCTVGNISHGRFRKRSPESAVEELLQAKERYGIRNFVVVDENFSFDMDRAARFCELLIERRVGLRWTAFEGIRADCLTPEFLALLKRSGCGWVFFGIESAENAVLKKVIKGSRFEHIERAVSLARQGDVRVGGFLIVGLPDSTLDTDLRTIDWATSTLDKMQFWMSTPYYGTSLYNWVLKYATLLREPVGDNIVNSLSTQPFYEMPQYTAAQIKQAHTVASLRTGIDFFFEYLDREAYNRLRWSDRQKSAHQRRLVSVTNRWDPSWLPKIAPSRTFPQIQDPLQAARERKAAGIAEPLPNDFIGGMSTPLRTIHRKGATV